MIPFHFRSYSKSQKINPRNLSIDFALCFESKKRSITYIRISIKKSESISMLSFSRLSIFSYVYQCICYLKSSCNYLFCVCVCVCMSATHVSLRNYMLYRSLKKYILKQSTNEKVNCENCWPINPIIFYCFISAFKYSMTFIHI